MSAPWKESYDKPRQRVKKQRHHFADKGPYSQSYGSSSSQILIRELDHKKTEHQRIDAFKLWSWKKLLRVPWTARRSKPVNPKRNQPRIFIGSSDAEADASLLCLPDVKN